MIITKRYDLSASIDFKADIENFGKSYYDFGDAQHKVQLSVNPDSKMIEARFSVLLEAISVSDRSRRILFEIEDYVEVSRSSVYLYDLNRKCISSHNLSDEEYDALFEQGIAELGQVRISFP